MLDLNIPQDQVQMSGTVVNPHPTITLRHRVNNLQNGPFDLVIKTNNQSIKMLKIRLIQIMNNKKILNNHQIWSNHQHQKRKENADAVMDADAVVGEENLVVKVLFVKRTNQKRQTNQWNKQKAKKRYLSFTCSKENEVKHH